MSEVITQIDGHVSRITINRPEKRNALNQAVIAGITDGLRCAGADENVRVVVLTGAGMDFCSGADLSALQLVASGSVAENYFDAHMLTDLFECVRALPIPVVAAVKGRALAGGCGLATICDLVLAQQSARFGYPEIKIGFVPAIVMAILRRNVSEKRAFELVALGGEIDASHAERIGLINRVFADDSFDTEVEALLQQFKKTSRTALSLSKHLLYQMDGLDFTAALKSGAEINTIARMTDDCRNGVEKFLKSK